MAVYRNENNGTWYSMVRYTDWKGERKSEDNKEAARRIVSSANT